MQGRKLLMDIQHIVDFVQMKRFDDPLLIQILEAMRVPGGRKISDEAWRAIEATRIQEAGGADQPAPETDPRLRDARGWYECAYEWRIVSYTMHTHARLNAKASGALLYYIPSVDLPSVRLSQQQFHEMRAMPNIGMTAKLPGILPIYVGMEMILSDSYLPPRIVRGAPVVVVDIELHPSEPPLPGRSSIAAHGAVVLHFMPPCIYVRLKNSTDLFLVSASASSQTGRRDLRGVIAIQPTTRAWRFKGKDMPSAVAVNRRQIPLLPMKQCTLHGAQGKTAEPGIIAHWSYPVGLSPELKWLACYVTLSRPPRLAALLSHGLPDKAIIEGGPPQSIADAFEHMFSAKIRATRKACATARATMKWPSRP